MNSEFIIKNPEQSHRPGRVLLALLAVFVVIVSTCIPVFAISDASNNMVGSKIINAIPDQFDTAGVKKSGTQKKDGTKSGSTTGTDGTTGTDDAVSGGGSSGLPNAYYLSDGVLSDVDPNHSFYKDNSQYNVTSFGRIIGIALSNLNYRVAKWAYETFFINAYKALGFTNWNSIIRDNIFGGKVGYRAALIGLITIGMIALGIQMLYRQEEMVSSRRAVVKQIIAVLLIIFGMPMLLNILSNIALAGASAATSSGQSQLGLDNSGKDSYFNTVIRENVIDWEYVAARGALGVCDGVREAPSNNPAAKTPLKASMKDPSEHPNELTGAIYRRCLAIPDYYQLSTSKKSVNNISYIDPGAITNGLSDINYDEVLTEKTLNIAKNPAAMVVSLARRYNEDVLNACIALGHCYEAATKESTGDGVDFKRMTTGWHPSFDANYDDYVRYVRDAELVARSLQHYWPTSADGVIRNVGKKDDTAVNGVQKTYVETEDEGTRLIAPVESGKEATIMYGQVIPKTNSKLLANISEMMYNQFVKRSKSSKDSSKMKLVSFNNLNRDHYAYCGRLVLIEVNEGTENQEGADAVDKLAGDIAAANDKKAAGNNKKVDKYEQARKRDQDIIASGAAQLKSMITMPQLGAIPVQAKPKRTNPATSTTKKQDDTTTTTTPSTDANGLDSALTGGTTGSSDGGDEDQNTITSVRLMNPNAGCRVTDPKVDPYIWKGLNTDGTMQDTVKTFLLHDREGNQVDSSGAVGKQMGGAKVAPYYRYSIDFLAIALECLALALAYIALAYKILRTIFDIVLTSIVAPFFASVDFASQGTKTKEILKGILQAYVTLLYYPIVIDVYMIGCRYIQQTWGGAEDTKLFYLFILFAWSIAMIDTPVILGNLLGQQTQRSFLNDISTVATGLNQGTEFAKKVVGAGGKGLKAIGKAGSALAGAIGPEGAGVLGAAAATGAALSAFNKSGDVKGLAKNLKNASAQLDAANTNKSLQNHPARKALKGSSGGTPPIGAWFNQPAQADTKSALTDRSSRSKNTAEMKQLEAKNSGALPDKTSVEDVSPLIQQAKKAAPLGATAAMFGAAKGKSDANANANAKAKAGSGTTTSKSKTTKTTSNSSVSHREASQTTALRNAAGAGVAGAAAGAAAGKQVSEGKMDRQHTKETQVNEKNTRSATNTTRSQIRQERAAVLNHTTAGVTGAAAGAAAGQHTASTHTDTVSTLSSTTTGAVGGNTTHTAAIDSTTTAGMQAMPMADLSRTVSREPIAEPLNMANTAGMADTHSTATHHQTVQTQAHTTAQRTMETQDRNIHTTIQENRAQVSHQSAVTSSSTAQHTVHTNTVTSTTGSSVDAAIPQIASTSTSIASMAVPSATRQAEPVYASTQAGAPVMSNQTIHVQHQTMPGTNTTVDEGVAAASTRVSQPIHQTATQTMHVMADTSGSAAPSTITQSISSMATPSTGSTSTVHQHVVQEQASRPANHTVNQTTTVQGTSAPGDSTTTVHQTVVQEAAAPSSGSFGGGGSFYTTDNAPSSVRPEITHDYTPNVQPASPSRMDLPNLQHVASNGYVSTAPAAPSAPAAAPAETIFDMLSTAATSEGNLGSQAADILRERSAQAKSYASSAPKLRKERKG